MLDIKSVGIAGTGMMGAGIAEVAAKAGFDVIVRGRSKDSADRAFDKLTKSLGGQVEKGKLSADERDQVLSRVRTSSCAAWSWSRWSRTWT
jgi:3-hydroxybutyryl-CoA dehydrogenase